MGACKALPRPHHPASSGGLPLPWALPWPPAWASTLLPPLLDFTTAQKHGHCRFSPQAAARPARRVSTRTNAPYHPIARTWRLGRVVASSHLLRPLLLIPRIPGLRRPLTITPLQSGIALINRRRFHPWRTGTRQPLLRVVPTSNLACRRASFPNTRRRRTLTGRSDGPPRAPFPVDTLPYFGVILSIASVAHHRTTHNEHSRLLRRRGIDLCGRRARTTFTRLNQHSLTD